MQLVWPAAGYLTGYVAALERGWSADAVRGAAAVDEDLTKINADPMAFVSKGRSMITLCAPKRIAAASRVR
jgi:hypothetical protein